MQIAVLSDTHLSRVSSPLQRAFEETLCRMDAVLHCGDVTEETVWSYLNSHAAFSSVCGNMDAGRWAAALPRTRLLELGGYVVGLLHGDGLGLGAGPKRLAEIFPRKPDLICLGHSHRRVWVRDDNGVRILNPGSFSLPKDGRAGFALVDLPADGEPGIEWIDVA
jgi:hypothetical protein